MHPAGKDLSILITILSQLSQPYKHTLDKGDCKKVRQSALRRHILKDSEWHWEKDRCLRCDHLFPTRRVAQVSYGSMHEEFPAKVAEYMLVLFPEHSTKAAGRMLFLRCNLMMTEEWYKDDNN